MRISLFILLFVFVGCGKDVKLSNGLESASLITEGESNSVTSSGVLIRKSNAGGTDRIQTNGSTYNVSMYSAYNALEFIASRPLGSSISIQFKGKVTNQEILLEEIK